MLRTAPPLSLLHLQTKIVCFTLLALYDTLYSGYYLQSSLSRCQLHTDPVRMVTAFERPGHKSLVEKFGTCDDRYMHALLRRRADLCTSMESSEVFKL